MIDRGFGDPLGVVLIQLRLDSTFLLVAEYLDSDIHGIQEDLGRILWARVSRSRRMGSEIRVLIADDHPIFRQGLRLIIEAQRELTVVAEASDGGQALERLQHGDVTVAVLDVTMPVKDGFAVAREVRERRLAAALVFLTMHKDEHYLNAALDLGVRGYVLKDNATTEIVDCVRSVASGGEYISPTLTSGPRAKTVKVPLSPGRSSLGGSLSNCTVMRSAPQ